MDNLTVRALIYNTLTIPDQLFRDVKQVYGKVKGIIDKTKGLAYNLANMDEERRDWELLTEYLT